MKFWLFVFILLSTPTLAMESCHLSDQTNDSIAFEVSESDSDALINLVFSAFDKLDIDWSELVKDQPIDEEDLWLIDLFKTLMTHDDLNIAIRGLNALGFYYAEQIDPRDNKPVWNQIQAQNLIEKAARDDELSVASLLRLRSLCQQHSEFIKCDTAALDDQLYSKDAKNINSHLFALQDAVNTNDSELVDDIIKTISESNRSRSYSPRSAALSAVVQEYINNHKRPEIIQDVFIHQAIYTIEHSVDDLTLHADLLNRINTSELFDIAPFRPLLQSCSENEKLYSYCLKIADTMIENSNTISTTSVGYDLAIQTAELSENELLTQKMRENQKSFLKYLVCLNGNLVSTEFWELSLDPDYLSLFFLSQHEGKGLELAALYLYQKLNEAGIQAHNPESCGLRYQNIVAN